LERHTVTNDWRKSDPPFAGPTGPAAPKVGQEDLPIELQLDLLVDGELPEPQRRILLRRMEELGSHAAVGWRELALRFLERQTEKEAVRGLMAGGNVIPVEFAPPADRRKPLLWRVAGSRHVMGVAAGLAIAVTSATVTFYATRPTDVRNNALVFDAKLPAEALGAGEDVALRVPVVPASGTLQFPAAAEADAENAPAVARQTWVIQGDTSGRPIAIPVNTMMMQVH
jgi:hypothetical protein